MGYRFFPCLAFLTITVPVAVHAQKVDLVKCEKPKDKERITSFSVALPLPVDRSQSRVVRAFIEVGINPTEAGKVSNSVEWDSGINSSGLGYRRRVVRATIFEEDDGTSKVVVVPLQYSYQGGGESTNPLDQWDSGYGYKVWCAAKTVVDSLAAASDRIRLQKSTAATTIQGADSASR